jgi:predicted RNA-binding protein with RPS1 domain
VHISRLSNEPVNRVEDVVEIGQTVEVWVRRIDPKTGLIDLSMIEPLEIEWRDLKTGMVVKGKVTRIENFGAFVDIGAERPGLVHISEMSNDYVKTPHDVVKEGDEVEVKVIGVNRRKKRIRLSMKALEETPAQAVQRDREESRPQTINEPVPTAMEVAMREAMERAQEDGEEVEKESSKAKAEADPELDDLLSRTLKTRSEKK